MAIAKKNRKTAPSAAPAGAPAPAAPAAPAPAAKKARPAARQDNDDDDDVSARSTPLGLEVDGEVLEFIEALDRFKKANNRPFPSWSEVLFVLKELGYRRS